MKHIEQYFPGYYNIIPNGVDVDHFSRDVEPLPEFCDGKLNVLFVGRPEKRKGLKYLLRAFVGVQRAIPESRLIVVGAGKFSRYERAVRSARLRDVVFRSNVPWDELPRYHHSAHVFCAPNTGFESSGLVLLEAMAAGRPIVASNIDAFAGVMTHGVEGLLVRPEDAPRPRRRAASNCCATPLAARRWPPAAASARSTSAGTASPSGCSPTTSA